VVVLAGAELEGDSGGRRLPARISAQHDRVGIDDLFPRVEEPRAPQFRASSLPACGYADGNPIFFMPRSAKCPKKV
jgi:hypothetical protein